MSDSRHLKGGVRVRVVVGQVAHVIIMVKGHREGQGVERTFLTSSRAEMISMEVKSTIRHYKCNILNKE